MKTLHRIELVHEDEDWVSVALSTAWYDTWGEARKEFSAAKKAWQNEMLETYTPSASEKQIREFLDAFEKNAPYEGGDETTAFDFYEIRFAESNYIPNGS